ncbi:MAG: hypothetical protein ABIP55_05715, partial [Tepidisphaeraceae bacterium]
LMLVLALSGPSWPIVVGRLTSDGLLLLAWLVAAAGWGGLLPLPRHADERNRCLRAVTTVAAGIGVLSLLQLACGLAGLLHRSIGITLIALGIAFSLFRCRKLARRDVLAWLTAPAGAEWLWLAVTPALAMAIVAAFVPPGVLWGDEPHGYDVLEYHLQLPREWYELGRIAPLMHNVFSYFPLAMETHYLLAMQLKGGPWAGMYLAQLMHVAVVALSVVAVYGTARTLATGKLPALLAAVAAGNVPWLFLLAPVAYNEGGLLLFTTLAVGYAMRGLSPNEVRSRATPGAERSEAPDSSRWRDWLTAGVMAGFACGVKLTAVPLVLLIVPVVAIARRQRIRQTLTGVASFVIAGTLVFSPWLIRNYVWTRNPVFPEAQNAFGRAHFSETQSRRWERAHSPTEAQRPLRARLAAASTQIVFDWRFGWWLLPLAVLSIALAWRRPQAWAIFALLAAWLIFWLAFTHLQGRFYVVAIPIAAITLALPRERWQILTIAGGVATLAVVGLYLSAGVFNQRVAPFCAGAVLGVEDFSELLPQDLQDALEAHPDAPVALAGDAKAFLYQLTMSRLRYRTVFDVDKKPGESILQAWLGDQTGSPMIVVDPIELDRFSKTYLGIDPLPADFPGPRDRVSVLTPPASAPPH